MRHFARLQMSRLNYTEFYSSCHSKYLSRSLSLSLYLYIYIYIYIYLDFFIYGACKFTFVQVILVRCCPCTVRPRQDLFAVKNSALDAGETATLAVCQHLGKVELMGPFEALCLDVYTTMSRYDES